MFYGLILKLPLITLMASILFSSAKAEIFVIEKNLQKTDQAEIIVKIKANDPPLHKKIDFN